MPIQQKSSSSSTSTSIKRRGGSIGTSSKSAKSDAVSNKKNDRHNNEQPCCGTLAHFALQVLPAAINMSSFGSNHLQSVNSSDKSANKTSNSNNGEGIQDPFPILLREYVLDQHGQRQKIVSETTINAALVSTNSSGNKKKRKKKKKKKLNSSFNSAEDERKNQHEEEEEESPSSSLTQQETNGGNLARNSKLLALETCDSAPEDPICLLHPSIEVCIGASAEKPSMEHQNGENQQQDLQLKIEQQRRIQTLLDWFLDRYIQASQGTKTMHTAAVDASESTTEKKSPSTPATTSSVEPVLDLQQLHTYIATLSDESEPSSDLTAPKNNNINPALLPIAYVRAAVQEIQCNACRRDVERCLLTSSIYTEPPIRLTGVVVPTIYDSYRQQHDLEKETTQYQLLMEEGTAPPEHAEYWTWNRVFSTKEDQLQQPELQGWKLQRPLARTTADNHSWSMSDLDVLLQQYVILQGLAPDTVTGVLSWNDSNHRGCSNRSEALESISETAAAKSYAYDTDLSNVAQRFANSLESFYEDYRAAQNDESDINWKSFGVMKEADEACDVILHDMLRICCDVTRSVQLVLTEYPGDDFDDVLTGTHWATVQCTEVWRIYLGAAHEIFRQMSEYESKLFALIKENNSNGSDKLPEFFVNAEARALYRSLVDRKIRVCHGLTDKIDSRLRHPTCTGGWKSKLDTNKDTSFLRRVLLEEAYYKFVAGEAKQRRPWTQQQPLDVACEDVLTTIRECLSTVHGPTASKLLEEHHNRDEKLMRLLRNVDKHLLDRIQRSRGCGDDVDTAPYVLKHMLQQVRNVNSTSRPASNFASCSDKLDYLKQRREALGPALILVMKDWVRYRIFDRWDLDNDGANNALPIMPHAVRQRMLEERSPCHGGNERSRAACLLVGLFFRRLSDGYRGYQAHMAEQELLTTVASDGDNIQSKSSKKSKKKKGKKNGIAAFGVNEQSLESTTVKPEWTAVENGENKGEGGHVTDVVALVENPESSSETSTMAAAAAPTNGGAEVSIVAREGAGSKTSDDTSISVAKPLDSLINCGVYDKSDFQTAETFFVGRLTSLLEVGEDDIAKI